MRKPTLILLALLAFVCIVTPSFAAETGEGEEVASMEEVLSIFATDEAELEVMLVLSGEKSNQFEPKAGFNCFVFCGKQEQSCLVGCGFTPGCQLFCAEEYELCLHSYC